MSEKKKLEKMKENFIYKPKTKMQLKNWYKNKVREKKLAFINFEDFYRWYCKLKKECYYCKLNEEELQKIVMLGFLKSNRFPLNGKVTQGRARGVWLEIDRKNPKGKYSRSNCVLSCYYCNNDKSDVFNEIEYKKFRKDRVGYLKSLSKRKDVEEE